MGAVQLYNDSIFTSLFVHCLIQFYVSMVLNNFWFDI